MSSTPAKIPAFLTLTGESATVALSRPTEFNAVTVDKLTLRSPTVRDMRIATATANGDDEQRELNLFASLAGVKPDELEQLTLKDYDRVQAAYGFLVREN
ncbi:phage tail assembly protein [Enterobacterales bacterium AW_CKDN230030176-1A_HGKHYDSX7]